MSFWLPLIDWIPFSRPVKRLRGSCLHSYQTLSWWPGCCSRGHSYGRGPINTGAAVRSHGWSRCGAFRRPCQVFRGAPLALPQVGHRPYSGTTAITAVVVALAVLVRRAFAARGRIGDSRALWFFTADTHASSSRPHGTPLALTLRRTRRRECYVSGVVQGDSAGAHWLTSMRAGDRQQRAHFPRARRLTGRGCSPALIWRSGARVRRP